MRAEHPFAPIALRKASEDAVPYLYRYRAFRDENDSLRQILTENKWWFGSRKGFDDKRDSLLGGAVLSPEHLQRSIRESGGSELDVRKAIKDPTTAARIARAVQERVIDSIGILCLSEIADHPRLWKEYANRGYGACLCLDVQKMIAADRLHIPQSMKYLNAPQHCWNPEGADQLAETSATLLRKDERWAYQKEWRILWADGVGLHNLPIDALKAVILGPRLSVAKRRRIVGWAKSGPWNPAPEIGVSGFAS